MKSFLLAAMLLTLSGCDFEEMGATTREKEDFHYSYDLSPGGRLIVENFNGSVEIYGWDQGKVEINGSKYASTKEQLDELKVDVVASAGQISVRTVAPPAMGRRNNRGVKYVIHVPRKTRLERIESSNGPIRAENIEGEARLVTSNGPVRLLKYQGNVDARTSNGSITLDEFDGGASLTTSNGPISANGVRGYIDATTSNGSITTSIAEAAAAHSMKLRTSNGPLTLTMLGNRMPDVDARTSNGPITLRLPASAGAKLRAHTSNSGVTCDFALNHVMLQSKSGVEGEIGSGGPVMALTTSNGHIRVAKN
ncbi:MAG: DUF4097 family beta strand repeat protein [Acidobacteriia bacterium]|nr:DUF4097 family beta strand repeat protein [Terriglobia bacterium]